MSGLEFVDKDNDDYDVICGPIKLELSRGIDMATTQPVWRFWALSVHKEVVSGSGSGKVLKPSKFTKLLEEGYELSS